MSMLDTLLKSHSPLARQQPQQPISFGFLTTAEAAAMLKLRPSALEKWRLLGTGPKFLKLGKRAVRYRVSDVEHWIEIQQAQY